MQKTRYCEAACSHQAGRATAAWGPELFQQWPTYAVPRQGLSFQTFNALETIGFCTLQKFIAFQCLLWDKIVYHSLNLF